MGIKAIFFSFLILLSCGKDVSIPTKSLERQSSVTDAATENVYKDGVIVRSTEDKLKVGTKTYTISRYSSNLAFTFIQGLSDGTETAVKFKGELRGSEAIIEKIENSAP
jgi:hypothetical protein